MNNVINFSKPRKSKEEIYENASLKLAKIEAGASPEQIEEIEMWLCEDPSHMNIFLEMATVWDQLGVLSELSDIFPLNNNPTQPTQSEQQLYSRRNMLAASLFVAGILGIGGALHQAGSLKNIYDIFENEAVTTYETKIGESRTVVLVDGSEILLNTNSLMTINYTNKERGIILERGEGHFTVAKNKNKPFRVYVGSKVIEAVGTAFNIQHYNPDTLEVMVTEGIVKLITLDSENNKLPVESMTDKELGNHRLSLVAGDLITTEALHVGTIQKRIMNPDEMEVKLAWRNGMLLFQGETLEQLLKEVNRYTTIKIEADPLLMDIKVTGLYTAGDVDNLLVSLQQNFQINAKHLAIDHIMLTIQ